ncbi:RidA family protein [Gulosibacter molinativorax]|uniref:RidA family protein n=1 Tax=Gulosibacter molinativorax TaxID=256821 RepID=A0ABT7CAN6_9MICO|nr:RidA family protein [Gulosibacter molinativorax]MDJ1372258.1 RidA family protein [Gulosibacter molinativorax]QUY63457.1 Hypotetical protein [Gulosibacter molinativorax]
MTEWRAITEPPLPHPFPHSLSNDEWVIISGVVGISPEGELPEDTTQQTKFAIDHLRHALEAAGSGLHEIVYLKPYVSRREYAAELNEVVREALPTPLPASGALTVVGLLDDRMRVEFEAWAHRGAQLRKAEQ